ELLLDSARLFLVLNTHSQFSCFSLEYSILRKQPYHHLTLHAALKTYSKSDKYWLQHRTRLQLYSLHYKSPQLHHSLLLTLNYLTSDPLMDYYPQNDVEIIRLTHHLLMQGSQLHFVYHQEQEFLFLLECSPYSLQHLLLLQSLINLVTMVLTLLIKWAFLYRHLIQRLSDYDYETY